MIAEHEIAEPTDQVPAKPIPVSVGTVPATVGPNNDYNGYRIKADDSPKIYLVLFGVARWIQNPDDYNNLFRDWNGRLRFPQTRDIAAIMPIESALSLGVVLAKGVSAPRIYLITDNVKMWVTSPQVMDKYYFAWNRVVVVPNILIDSIPLGPNIY